MKLFERVIEERLRFHLEKIEFLNKHQSGYRRAKSTDDNLFRLSQSIMESFNNGEHVVFSWPCNTSQRRWFLVQPNKPQSRGSTGFCSESITFSDLRQRSFNTTPQTKISIPIRWWYCTMGFQLESTFCSKFLNSTFAFVTSLLIGLFKLITCRASWNKC